MTIDFDKVCAAMVHGHGPDRLWRSVRWSVYLGETGGLLVCRFNPASGCFSEISFEPLPADAPKTVRGIVEAWNHWIEARR